MSGAERVRTIVRDLKLFSRIEDMPGAVAAPNQVIQSTARMLSNEIEHRAVLDLDLGDVPPVVGDGARVGQVLTNLLINAVQALPDRRREDNLIRVRSRHHMNDGVLIEVSDNGPGISPEVQPHIFDPFFTTKAVGVGTGLGLSICHSIVNRLGGRIELDSKPGQGTTFGIWLVPASGPEDTAEPVEVADAPAAPRKRILCIDDEVDVGRLIARILRARHDVVIETDGARALSRLRAGERYDAIICDLMMPSMSGMDFYHELQASMPELARRCGFITGGVFTTAARSFAATLPPSRLIEKPFRGSVIHELVGHLMA
jgi:CheY-like chemotaxis protein